MSAARKSTALRLSSLMSRAAMRAADDSAAGPAVVEAEADEELPLPIGAPFAQGGRLSGLLATELLLAAV